MIPALGYIIRQGVGEQRLPGPQRVLAIAADRDAVWLINIPRDRSETNRKAVHMLGPRRYSLAGLSDAIERGQLVMENVPLPAIWLMTDADYVSDAPNKRERERREWRLKRRDQRWMIIEAIIGDYTAQQIVPVAYMLRENILAQAKIHHLSAPSIYSWIHRYWAGRECLNSLIPDTSQCGGPGKPKRQSERRLGRKSRCFKEGVVESPGYILKEGDTELLAYGYALVKPGLTLFDAYVLTSGAYWSQTVQNEHGRMEYELLPAHQRPTQVQFEYWGRKLYGEPFRRRMMGVDHWATSTLAVAGSAQDQVHAVGQMAMIDSTSTDIYLTSELSRLKVLPPMHRTVVIDVRSTFVPGFYCGWEDPSSETSLQAILCASGDKAEFAARFGIELGEDEWPGMTHRLYLADNGEMKSEAMKEAEKHFRFGVEFAKAYSGQSKSLVENQHHTAHKALDHKLPGTTRGRQRKRGEPPPPTKALLNYSEYIRELILVVLAYNKEEVPDLAPIDMKIAGVPPTRVNVFRWLRDHNMRADISCDLNQLRAFTLPDRKAVMRRDGIHLLMDDGIRHLPGHRFYMEDLTRDVRWRLAATKHSSVLMRVKLDAQDLSHVWLPTSTGLLQIPNVLADQIVQEKVTLADWTQWVASEDLRTDQCRQVHDQEGLNTVLRRGAVTVQAARQKRAAEASLPRKPSKQRQASELRKNKAEEMEHLGPATILDTPQMPPGSGLLTSLWETTAADRAMDAFHDGDEP